VGIGGRGHSDGRVTEVNRTTATTDAMDDLAWDDWDAVVCSFENGADCTACEG
jgi:hypothetical protein